VVCNADEGEPGTFKDRVLLTELPDRVFAGMTIAGYAIGATEGILYLRGEYAYLRRFLEHTLEARRADGLLGRGIVARHRFDFDIRIQMGAGAYICGEETALINSCEGLRGDPRNRPPFPAQRGYLGRPTVVNNVETLACVTRILEVGPATFSEHGSRQSAGTKLISVSGDVGRPGVYEVPFGIKVGDVLAMSEGRDAIAIQIGGPSGRRIDPADFERTICYDDIATGGALVVFGPGRNPIEIAHMYMEFFEDESCGYCTPCRVGNVLLRRGLERILAGRGEPKDLVQLEEIARTMKAASRCGLGQTSSNPVLTTLAAFRPLYDSLVKDDPRGFRRSFDLQAAVADAERIRTGGGQ
jgi:[NiFe] hydrogenase diaphorase moiety large subunit